MDPQDQRGPGNGRLGWRTLKTVTFERAAESSQADEDLPGIAALAREIALPWPRTRTSAKQGGAGGEGGTLAVRGWSTSSPSAGHPWVA